MAKRKPKLKAPKACKWCGGELEFIPGYVHESVETNEDVVHDVWKCRDENCETLHYYEDGYFAFEHLMNINRLSYDYKPLKTDYQVAREKMQRELTTCNSN